MVTLDRIRLTGLLRKIPAFAGIFYVAANARCSTVHQAREIELGTGPEKAQ